MLDVKRDGWEAAMKMCTRCGVGASPPPHSVRSQNSEKIGVLQMGAGACLLSGISHFRFQASDWLASRSAEGSGRAKRSEVCGACTQRPVSAPHDFGIRGNTAISHAFDKGPSLLRFPRDDGLNYPRGNRVWCQTWLRAAGAVIRFSIQLRGSGCMRKAGTMRSRGSPA